MTASRKRVDITLTGEACANVLQAAAAVEMAPNAWARGVVKQVAAWAVVQDEINRLEAEGFIVRTNPCAHCGKPHASAVTPVDVIEELQEIRERGKDGPTEDDHVW